MMPCTAARTDHDELADRVQTRPMGAGQATATTPTGVDLGVTRPAPARGPGGLVAPGRCPGTDRAECPRRAPPARPGSAQEGNTETRNAALVTAIDGWTPPVATRTGPMEAGARPTGRRAEHARPGRRQSATAGGIAAVEDGCPAVGGR